MTTGFVVAIESFGAIASIIIEFAVSVVIETDGVVLVECVLVLAPIGDAVFVPVREIAPPVMAVRALLLVMTTSFAPVAGDAL